VHSQCEESLGSIEDRQTIIQLVRRFAGATTDAILDPTMQFFSIPHVEGFISYRIEAKVAIVFGDPTCTQENLKPLTQAFHTYIETLCKNVVYISTSQVFAHWAIGHACGLMLELCEELILNPLNNPYDQPGTHGSLVRRKVKRALREGVSFHEYTGSDLQIEQEIEAVGELWLKGRTGPQFHISNVYPFQDRLGKRWFYARKDGEMVGVIMLNELQASNGWLMNHLMTVENAPTGTSELLVISTLAALRSEGCSFTTVGFAPAKQLGEIIGLNKLTTWFSRQLFNLAKKAGKLDGLNMFWGKFQPERRPSYLLFYKNSLGLREMLALRRALNSTTQGKS
jgi:lysylphosphatidylglycerol synthetase-like protein (DUF2156 family)